VQHYHRGNVVTTFPAGLALPEKGVCWFLYLRAEGGRIIDGTQCLKVTRRLLLRRRRLRVMIRLSFLLLLIPVVGTVPLPLMSAAAI
jgi:hypothetical protein